MGEGIIYEPVKFYLAKKADLRGVAMTELVAAMMDGVFPEYRGTDFGLIAQYLYTFNPLREGQLLYSGRGMNTLDQYQSVTKDGIKWHVFGSAPGDFLQMFHSLSAADAETAAGKYLLSLRRTARMLEESWTK
jgi:hypothetical protein